MSSHESRGAAHVVLTAILVNALVTITEAVGWLISLSPSMLAEAIHSLADTVNQSLVYMGIKISKKGPPIAEELSKNNLNLDELIITVKMIGQFINSIENKVYKQFPDIKYIDLEIN